MACTDFDQMNASRPRDAWRINPFGGGKGLRSTNAVDDASRNVKVSMSMRSIFKPPAKSIRGMVITGLALLIALATLVFHLGQAKAKVTQSSPTRTVDFKESTVRRALSLQAASPGVAHKPGHKPFLKGTTKPSKKRCFTGLDRQRHCHANVFFFGVSKCGTTSLAAWLEEHPQVKWVTNLSKMKDDVAKSGEAHVLDVPSWQWHRMVKAGRYGKYGITAPAASEEDVVIDYTPHYATIAETPYRIYDRYGSMSHDGSVKYVVLLREPVSRTISSWEFKYDINALQTGRRPSGLHHEQRTLAEAVEQGTEMVSRLIACVEGATQDAEIPPELPAFSYERLQLDLVRCNPRRYLERNEYFAHVGKSTYILELERWFALFGRENIKVIFLEEMAADPVGSLEDVLSFMGLELLDSEVQEGWPTLEQWAEIVRRNHNPTSQSKKDILNRQKTPEILESLRRFFVPHNRALQELIGRPLPDSWSTEY